MTYGVESILLAAMTEPWKQASFTDKITPGGRNNAEGLSGLSTYRDVGLRAINAYGRMKIVLERAYVMLGILSANEPEFAQRRGVHTVREEIAALIYADDAGWRPIASAPDTLVLVWREGWPEPQIGKRDLRTQTGWSDAHGRPLINRTRPGSPPIAVDTPTCWRPLPGVP
jgi:hypothetical protein